MADIQDCAYGKTCREHSAPTGERISDVSLKRSAKSLKSQYMCLDLRSGTLPGQYWETAGHLLGDSSMLNTSESLKDAVESTLSQILQVNVLEKYYLSAKACEGILRRAERRGKQLPEMLRVALEQQIQSAV